MDSQLLIVLEVQCQGLEVEVLLNDVVVYAERAGTKRTTQLKLNPWIVSGSNPLSARIAAKWGKRDELPTGPLTPYFLVAIIEGVHGKVPGDAGRRAAYAWSHDDVPLDPAAGLTTVWRHDLSVLPAFGWWSWQDAQPTSLSLQDRGAVLGLVTRLHQVLERRDLPVLLQLLSVKHKEMCQALGIPWDPSEAGPRKYFRRYFEAKGWALEPLVPEKLVLRAEANGRVVSVHDPRAVAPLRGSTANEPFHFDLTVSNIDGVWTVVR